MAKQARGKTAGKTRKSAAKKSKGSASKRAKVSRSSSRNQETILLVGTMKGAFVLRSDKSRKNWKIEGPHFRGEAVYALLHDTRAGRPRTFAATNSIAEAFLQAATHAPQPIQAAASIARSDSGFGMGIVLPSGVPPVLTEINPPA